MNAITRGAGEAEQCGATEVVSLLLSRYEHPNGFYELDFYSPELKLALAGQFFMVKPIFSPVFLPRPLGVLRGRRSLVSFFVEPRGTGTVTLCAMKTEMGAKLIGPLGRPFSAVLPPSARKIALVSGGTGFGPLSFLSEELNEREDPPVVHFYTGFKTGWNEQKRDIFGLIYSTKLFFTSEDGVHPWWANQQHAKGLVTALFHPEGYDAVVTCGPLPMMKAVAAQCKAAGVRCFVSMEERMACGVGACLGCTIDTINGKRRCCADGPVFDAEELLW